MVLKTPPNELDEKIAAAVPAVVDKIRKANPNQSGGAGAHP
jgi:hypothetical protein